MVGSGVFFCFSFLCVKAKKRKFNIMQDISYKEILIRVLGKAKAEHYSGYEKFDALNSPFLKFMTLKNAWLRLIYIQTVKEFPINLRPLFGVKKSINQKGVALFARANLFLYEKTKEKKYLDEAIALIGWLLKNPSPHQKNLCWGYNFIWQDLPPFCQNKDEPNVVVTCFAGEAIAHAYRITKNEEYLKALNSIRDFITKDLEVLFENENERAISYILTPVDSIVLNVQVMSASLLSKISNLTGDRDLMAIARKQINFTVNRRTDYNAWYYTFPYNKSYIRHDNYHTGGILDNLLEYIEESGENELMEIYFKGLEFYKENLFEKNGAPRWMNDKKYPHDIHGAAQGIITFSKAAKYNNEYLCMAEMIADWTIQNMYRENKHDFIYRAGKFYKWNFSLIRWCNGWMARAIAELIQYDNRERIDI